MAHKGLRVTEAVNSKIYARFPFSRNFAYVEFREKKNTHEMAKTLCPTDVGKSCQIREFLTWLICLLMLFAKIKLSRKFPNLQYLG